MSGEQDAEEFFDLVVERAKRIMKDPKAFSNPSRFWQDRVKRAWHNVYQHMTRPSPEYGVWKTTAARRETALRFANLGYEAFMAAWYIGIQCEDGQDMPFAVAKRLCEMWEQMPPSTR